MSGFQIGSDSIDLSGPPWNVTEVVAVYVQNLGGELRVFKDAQATMPLEPPEIVIRRNVSTGIYVYMTTFSDAGTKFTDGQEQRPEPVTWDEGNPPASVTYGKVLADRQAFSLKDEWDHPDTERHEFDIHVELPDGTISRLQLGADPVIVEPPEIPPDGDQPPPNGA